VALTAPEEVQTSDIPISYTIFDQKNRSVRLRPEYSISGAEWKPATVSGKTTGIDPQEYSGTLTWKGRTDLAGFAERCFSGSSRISAWRAPRTRCG